MRLLSPFIARLASAWPWNSRQHATATALAVTTTTTTTTVNTNLVDILPPFDPDCCQRRIFLLRHGETDWNLRGLMQGGGYDIPLNDNGQQQAELVAHELLAVLQQQQHQHFHVGAVASSHLQRSQQTADALQRLLKEQHHPVPRRSLPEFGEMRFGDLEGTIIHGPETTEQSRNAFKVHDALMHQDKNLAWPGTDGESTAQVEARGRQGLAHLYQEFPNVHWLVIVAHGRFNRILLASLLYQDALKYYEIQQGNTCINVIDQLRTDGSYQPVILNFMDHTTRPSSPL